MSIYDKYFNVKAGRHLKTGRAGETIAGEFLKGKGHDILHANFRCGHKEIDLISVDKGILVFTEIKTRSNFLAGFPEEAVTIRKQQLLKAAAESYLAQYPQYKQVRFDIVSILLHKGQATEILHFEDAFY